jgi:hypothetical protein
MSILPFSTYLLASSILPATEEKFGFVPRPIVDYMLDYGFASNTFLT